MQAWRRLALRKLRATLRNLHSLSTNPHIRRTGYALPVIPLYVHADAHPQTHFGAFSAASTPSPNSYLTLLSEGDPIALSQARHHPLPGLPPALASAALNTITTNPPLAIAALALLADLAAASTNHHFFTAETLQTLSTILSQHPTRLQRLLGANPLPEEALTHLVRGLANLSAEQTNHQTILSTPILPAVCRFLTTDYPELRRETVRAVSALSKSDPRGVVNANAHVHLIRFAKDGSERLYAAAGIRNLARKIDDVTVHRELVVAGVVDALTACFNVADQARVFAVLAFGDIMTTAHPKRHIIERWLRPAYEEFAKLLTEKNPALCRAMYRVLQTLFDTPREGADGERVPKELGVLLAQECGQLVNGAVARGDVPALKAVRVMCKDDTVSKGMVDKGLLEVLVRGLKQGKGEYWEECTAALANLSSCAEHTQLIVSRGALRAVIARPCLERNALRTVSFFANMARSPELHAEVGHGGLKVLLLALSSKDKEAVREAARAVYNLSLGGVSKVMVGQRGGLHPLITAVRGGGEARKFAVGALAEISDAFEQATKMIEADIISVLLAAVREDPSLARSVAKCVANLSMVAETHGSLAQTGAAEWLMEMISRNGGRGADSADVMHFCTVAACNIAYSPGITRSKLREHGAMSILSALSSSGMSSPLVLHNARTALSNLRGAKPMVVPVDGATKVPSPA